MHSLFGRSRTSSKKDLPKIPNSVYGTDGVGPSSIDEFGRVHSRGGGGNGVGVPPTPSKDRNARQRTTSTPDRRQPQRATTTSDVFYDEPQMEEGFLPTSMSPPEVPQQQYGYLSHEVHVVLSVEDVTNLVEIISDELGARGLTTPFLFSNTALDISTAAVRRLISSFLYNVNPALAAPTRQNAFGAPNFREEAKFAEPHDLGMVLRWGLARIVRVHHGLETRGLMSWDTYLQWRRVEHESNYDKQQFLALLSLLPPPAQSLMLVLFTLLCRLLAHSTSSGLTPPTLAALFGPLLFGLGAGSPSSGSGVGSFHAAYVGYLRACHATEHFLLSFVRLQIAQTSPSSPPPRRLLSWIQGYPSTLPKSLADLDRPRKGVKIRRVASVRRNVRLYTPDLVKNCAGWAKGPEGASIRQNREWERISPPLHGDKQSDRMDPRYSDMFKKKLDLPPSFIPVSGAPTSSSSTLSTPSLSAASSTASSSTAKSTLMDETEFGLGLGKGVGDDARFRSLTDMRWGEFETMGFSDGDKKKLQFDLNESARSERNVKRTTLTWADFSSAGFSRTDSSLSATLQFSPPVTTTITQWPESKEDIHRKLKKNQKALPAFGWDTSPIMDGREEVIEESFIDVFCDLLYGGGWMDRNEGTFRECNWALVEFKALPNSTDPKPTKSTLSSDGSLADPRTATTLLLFEEFVPYEYRASLISQGDKPNKRTRLFPSLLSSSKKSNNNKQWKPAATLNGRPYVVGNVPRSPSSREAEFERLLAGGGGALTKVITLETATRNGEAERLRSAMSSPMPPQQQQQTASPSTSHPNGNGVSGLTVVPPPTPNKGPETPSKYGLGQGISSPTSAGGSAQKKSRFRFPAVGGSVTSKNGLPLTPAEYDRVEFETRLASYSDDELNNPSGGMGSGMGIAGGKGVSPKDKKEHKRRMSKDDAWVDILVASTSATRMKNQDADLPTRGISGIAGLGAGGGLSPINPIRGIRGLAVSGGSGGRSDPELAREEVNQALEALRHNPPPPTDDDEVQPLEASRSREWEPPASTRDRDRDHEASRRHEDDSFASTDSAFDTSAASSNLKEFPKKRLGYFDLHPERRRDIFVNSVSSSGSHPDYQHQDRYLDEGDESQHSHLEPSTSARGHSIDEGHFHDNDEAYGGYQRDTAYSAYSEISSFEPVDMDMRKTEDGDIEVPAFVETDPDDIPLSRTHPAYGRYFEHAKTESMTLPTTPTPTSAKVPPELLNPHDTNDIPITAPLNIASPKPSRLPIRSSSLPPSDDPPTPLRTQTMPPSNTTGPSITHVQSDSESDDAASHDEELANNLRQPTFSFVPEELGRSSPLRYVHGAPLHNVIEEGEEEEE